jgi:hypothetical protein
MDLVDHSRVVAYRSTMYGSRAMAGAAACQMRVTDHLRSQGFIAVAWCDRTTLEMRGLSPKIILGDSRRSENAQTHINKHTRPNMKFKLKLLQIK